MACALLDKGVSLEHVLSICNLETIEAKALSRAHALGWLQPKRGEGEIVPQELYVGDSDFLCYKWAGQAVEEPMDLSSHEGILGKLDRLLLLLQTTKVTLPRGGNKAVVEALLAACLYRRYGFTVEEAMAWLQFCCST